MSIAPKKQRLSLFYPRFIATLTDYRQGLKNVAHDSNAIGIVNRRIKCHVEIASAVLKLIFFSFFFLILIIFSEKSMSVLKQCARTKVVEASILLILILKFFISF